MAEGSTLSFQDPNAVGWMEHEGLGCWRELPEGAEGCGGSDRNSPKHPTPALRLSGAVGGHPMLALRWAARYFQLFRRGTCGASGGQRAEGSGHRAAGRAVLPLMTNLGAERCKTTVPPGTASPLPALPGAPLPRRGKRQCHWCYWCDWCPPGSSWPGNALSGSPCQDQTTSHLLCLGPGTRAGPHPVRGWLSVGQHLPKSPSTKSAPWSVPRLPPAPQTAGHPSCCTPGQGHAWASAVVLRPAHLFVKRRAKRERKMLFPGPGRQCRRGSRAAHPASASRATPGSERPTWTRPGGAAAGVGPEPRPARLLQLPPRPRSSSQPGCFV